ncbi:MAG: hypothetical protein HZB20_01260 [Chloroflexi bacterium]|nr:hypothetical protein [Chloroflexota bacterium]
MQVMPMETFEGVGEVEVGMQFRARTAEGTQILTVVEVDGDNVTFFLLKPPLPTQTTTFTNFPAT